MNKIKLSVKKCIVLHISFSNKCCSSESYFFKINVYIKILSSTTKIVLKHNISILE